MNRWVQRGLRTALLTGGFLAVGAGVAAADENDLTADVLGVTATVPVADAAVVQTPVLTGHGGNTTAESGTGGGLDLPVDTDTAPGTTALASDGTGGVSAPVRVTEATDSPPDPADGLTVTVPVNTSGGGSAGTTITVPVVTGDVGDVLDGDPLTGNDIDVDVDGPLVLGTAGSGVLVDAEDTVTIGDTDGRTASDTVLEVPVGLEGDRPTTVTLPLGGGDGTAEPLSGNDVDVYLGQVTGDGRPPAADEPNGDAEPALTVPVDTGNLLSDAVEGEAVSGNSVDVHLLLGDGSATGSVVTVPMNDDGSGTGSDNLVRITLPIDLSGDAGADEEPGSGEGTDEGSGEGSGAGLGFSASADSGGSDGSGGGSGAAADFGTGAGVEGGSGAGAVAAAGTVSPSGTDSGNAGSGPGAGSSVDDGGDPCGVGGPGTVATRSSATGQSAVAIPAMAGMLALGAGLLLALGRGTLRGDRSQR